MKSLQRYAKAREFREVMKFWVLNISQWLCCEDNKRYFGLENSRFNFTVSLVLHFHLDSSDDSDNYLENLTACELQNKSNCQSKKLNLITPKPTRTIA